MGKKFIKFIILVFLCAGVISQVKTNKKKSWRDKDIRDMSDADLEHLLDQWEENDEPLEPDELPEHLRPSPKIDLSKLDMSNPDNVLRVTKRGKGVMMFVDVDEEISTDQAEIVMRIWQSSLQNNHIIAERYPIDGRRSVFLFREGSQAVDAKAYLLEQPELSHVTLEGQTYYRTKTQKKGNVASSAKADQQKTSKKEKQKKIEL